MKKVGCVWFMVGVGLALWLALLAVMAGCPLFTSKARAGHCPCCCADKCDCCRACVNGRGVCPCKACKCCGCCPGHDRKGGGCPDGKCPRKPDGALPQGDTP